jgi:membrane protein implicated in regulation of membrane protease activity
MEIFTEITAYHWVALGLILLTAEMLGASGFLLGAAAAAFAMGVVAWIVPGLSIPIQLAIYGAGATVLTIVYFQLFRDAQKKPARPLLNKRAKRLIGHQFKLDKAVELGSAKVQIGDTLWTVESEEELTEGTLVEVIDTHRMSLKIAAKA